MPPIHIQKACLGEVGLTIVTLQLANRSVKHPRGVIEDMLAKVDRFIFPTNLVVLNMEEDKDILVILGRPFLATGKALIDVQKVSWNSESKKKMWSSMYSRPLGIPPLMIIASK